MKRTIAENLFSSLPVALVSALVEGNPSYFAIGCRCLLNFARYVFLSLFKKRCTCLTRHLSAGVCGVALCIAGGSWELGAAPILSPFAAITASEGTRYAGFLLLDDWVADGEFNDSELAWSVEGQRELLVRITAERHLVIEPPDADWFGTADLILAVCNPAGECASGVLSVRVENTPDDPVLERLPDQVAASTEPFRTMDLGLFSGDPDGDKSFVWSVAAPEPLIASVDGSLLTVTRPLPSAGSWPMEVTLGDSDGRFVTQSVTFTAAEKPVAVTLIGNAGFLIEVEGRRVLIDALVNEGIAFTQSERRRLRSALCPFDRVDLALATHAHYDHFDAATAASFLAASSSTVFLSLDESIDKLRSMPSFDAVAGRVVGIPFQAGEKSEHDIGDIHVTAFATDHSLRGGNLAFLIEIGDIKILHVGDTGLASSTELLRYDWPSLDVDVALVPLAWLFDTAQADRVTAGIAPRFVIPMHFPPGACPALAGIETQTSAVSLCRQFETWIVPPRSSAP